MKKIEKHYFFYGCIWILIGMVSLMLVGCQLREDNEPTMGVTIYRYDDMFISILKKEMKLYAQDKIKLNINDSGNNQENQKKQIDALISKKMDVLAINLVDTSSAMDVINVCREKDMPVVFFNREPKHEVLESYNQCWYVGTDSKEAGILQGQMILNGWKSHPEWDKNGDGIMQYVMLQGEEDHVDAVLRSNYVIDTIVSEGVEVDCLVKDYANWDSLEAKELMDQWLISYGDKIEVIISNNDAMAIGAIVSLQQDGYLTKDRYVPIVGVDGLPEFLHKIKNGLAVGTVINDAIGQSKAVVDLGLNIVNGETPLKGIQWEVEHNKIVRVPYIPITIDNVDMYIEVEE